MRKLYYGKSIEYIIDGTVKKFKNQLKSYDQLDDVTGYILTTYFGWFSPTEPFTPNERLQNFALHVLSCGTSIILAADKKASDRADAKELAAIVYDRIKH
ncbi:MAG: hypothetical protein K6G50_12930 [bacterium]|nr:hypothetical protein [bacterium]